MQADSAPSEEVLALRRAVKEAQAELELKDLELKACNPKGPFSCDDAKALREELREIESQITRIEEKLQSGCADGLVGVRQRPATLADSIGSDDACGITGAWRLRVAELEEELQEKCEVVSRLRQREFWFEMQLKRQQEMHGNPLDAVLDEVLALSKGVESNAGLQRRHRPAPSQPQQQQPIGGIALRAPTALLGSSVQAPQNQAVPAPVPVPPSVQGYAGHVPCLSARNMTVALNPTPQSPMKLSAPCSSLPARHFLPMPKSMSGP
eukprot:TRINITY_DN116660_c0_g1_i1.p1 TRINITY_DN116660_c0_g1~~TRINITY_DN116660_c0_g1_i1.p1  ORF type:complete len:267 (+),score=62.21 TRINITY_DN116660_c0_g1_i1:52-852(+)